MQKSTRQFEITSPIIIDRRKKVRKSAYVDEALRFESHLTRAAGRLLKASDAGLAVYRKGRKKSRKKKSPRYVMEALPHLLDGSAVAARKMSYLPIDLAKAVYTKRTARLVRGNVKTVSRLASRVLLP